MIVSSDDSLLLGGGSGAGASPWAIAAKRAGIRGLDSVINAVILTSAWSAGNSYLFLASRTLYSMALVGNAPRLFTRCTKSGIPYVATAVSASFCVLAYLKVSDSGATVFNWFVNLINTGGYMSWIAICVIYLRFRKATFVQGITIPLSISAIRVLSQWLNTYRPPARQRLCQLHPRSLECIQLLDCLYRYPHLPSVLLWPQAFCGQA